MVLLNFIMLHLYSSSHSDINEHVIIQVIRLFYILTSSLLVLSNLSPGVGLSSTAQSMLSRPMQRKLVTLVHCQLVEEEGRVRAMRAARSLGERTVTELILQHQNPQQLSSNLWAAVRARGCQFLGPGTHFSITQKKTEKVLSTFDEKQSTVYILYCINYLDSCLRAF